MKEAVAPFSVSGSAADVNSVNFSMKMGPPCVKGDTNTWEIISPLLTESKKTLYQLTVGIVIVMFQKYTYSVVLSDSVSRSPAVVQ